MLRHFKRYMNQTRTYLHITAIPPTIWTNLDHWLRAIYVTDRFRNACVKKTVQFLFLPGTVAVCAQNHKMFVKALEGKMWFSISRSEIGRWWLKKKESLHGVGAAVEGTYDSFCCHSIQICAHTFAFQHIPVVLQEWKYMYFTGIFIFSATQLHYEANIQPVPKVDIFLLLGTACLYAASEPRQQI